MSNAEWKDYQRRQEDAYYAEKEEQDRREDDHGRQANATRSRHRGNGISSPGTVPAVLKLGFFALLVASFVQVAGPFFGSITVERPAFTYSPATFLVLAVVLHLVLIVSRRNRLLWWLSIPLLCVYATTQLGVLDCLRGGFDRSHLLDLSASSATAMGFWLFACFVYRRHIHQAGIAKEREVQESLLQSANDALIADASEGKEGERRVHDALDLALRRQFGPDVVLIPRGGLLSIDGPVPFTDIDHIVVTPRCVVVVETKDWKWQHIAPVPGDDALIERRRPGQVERVKNPYIQASRKPGHLRRAIGLEVKVPIEFVVCFADFDTQLDSRLPENMTTIRTLPDWLLGTIHRHHEKLDVAVIAERIAERLDYNPASYERFRRSLDSGEAYQALLKQRETARVAMMDSPAPILPLTSFRPGHLPLAMFAVSVALFGLALLIVQTGGANLTVS